MTREHSGEAPTRWELLLATTTIGCATALATAASMGYLATSPMRIWFAAAATLSLLSYLGLLTSSRVVRTPHPEAKHELEYKRTKQ